MNLQSNYELRLERGAHGSSFDAINPIKVA